MGWCVKNGVTLAPVSMSGGVWGVLGPPVGRAVGILLCLANRKFKIEVFNPYAPRSSMRCSKEPTGFWGGGMGAGLGGRL